MECRSLLPQYDEIIRCYNVLVDKENVEEAFHRIVSRQEMCVLKYKDAVEECKRLKLELDRANKDLSTVNMKLSAARGWLDKERKYRKCVEAEKEALTRHLDEVRCILLADPRHKLSDEAKEKLSFLNRVSSESSSNGWYGPHGHDRLNTIAESDSMSDMSFSRSGDDLDDYPMGLGSKHRPLYTEDENTARKKRKSSVDGHFISPPPPPPSTQSDLIKTPTLEGIKCSGDNTNKLSGIEKMNMRTHNFVTKTFIMPESCYWCAKKVGFGRSVLKCLDCHSVAHPECYEKTPSMLPCIPMGTSPKKTGAGFINDYTPSSPPMIPAVVVRCAMEVERRGLRESGIYRTSGPVTVVRGLYEKLQRGKGVPCLTDVDIHSVCGFLKEFLRGIQDTLITQKRWSAFASAISNNNKKTEKLQEIVLTLPQANRDTLAYLILHLHKVVANCAENKMTTYNLAIVFGPTVVGYSGNEQGNDATDTPIANAIMEELILLPASYWNSILSDETSPSKAKTLLYGSMQTPEGVSRRLMSTPGSKRKYFKMSPP